MSSSPSPPLTPSSPRPILQPRTPTGVSTTTDTPVVRIPADNHGHTPDLDPTEWKPKATRSARPASHRYNSEAFRYLSSFHRAINKNEPSDDDTPRELRIDVPNMGATAATAPTTPSLGNTPTTAASSWSVSTSAGYTGQGGYDYNIRPLVPRHNRWYSTGVIGGGGVDLVTPHIPPPPANEYAKKDVMVGADKQKGGLGAFFCSEME